MALPKTDFDVPFDITRASHVVLRIRDLDVSLPFYTEVIGLVVTEREEGVAYLRGVEETCHHSLVLRESDGPAVCERLGLRVFRERDLDALHDFFAAAGLPAAWAEIPHQGRTLHVSDPVGTPLEFCATMPTQPRLIVEFTRHRGAAAHRIDHLQLHAPQIQPLADLYCAAGFRISEYIAPEGDDPLSAIFLQRKGNPHDIVFFEGLGPRLHHIAFTSPDVTTILRACDLAGEMGYGERVERGPGRHGPGHAQYTYMLDPDGHRIEVFTTHYQMMDFEDAPKRWQPGDLAIARPWGLPARRRWFDDATEFAGVAPREPDRPPTPVTLERYLAET